MKRLRIRHHPGTPISRSEHLVHEWLTQVGCPANHAAILEVHVAATLSGMVTQFQALDRIAASARVVKSLREGDYEIQLELDNRPRGGLHRLLSRLGFRRGMA